MTVREAIHRLVLPLIKPAIRTGNATNIDLDAGTCDVDLQNGAFLHEVKLQAIAPMGTASAVKGFLVVPVEGSMVQAAMIEGLEENWTLMQYSQVETIYLNGNDLGGLVIVQKLWDKINALETKMNTHTHPYMNGAVAAVTSVTGSQIQPLTTRDELENKKVQHGSGA